MQIILIVGAFTVGQKEIQDSIYEKTSYVHIYITIETLLNTFYSFPMAQPTLKILHTPFLNNHYLRPGLPVHCSDILACSRKCFGGLSIHIIFVRLSALQIYAVVVLVTQQLDVVVESFPVFDSGGQFFETPNSLGLTYKTFLRD